jgi:hypothetical protein
MLRDIKSMLFFIDLNAYFIDLSAYSLRYSRCYRRSGPRSSKIALPVKSQTDLFDSFHCFKAAVQLSLPLSATKPQDCKGVLQAWLDKCVAILKTASSVSIIKQFMAFFLLSLSQELVISATDLQPVSFLQDSDHQVVFLQSSLLTPVDNKPFGRYEGVVTGIAYTHANATLADAISVLRSDIVKRW